MSERKKNYIQSIERAVSILNLFENSKELRLVEISEQLKLNKTTVFGILETLVHLKMLEKDGNSSGYRLGLGLFRLSQFVDIDIIRISKPFLREIAEASGETVNLIALEDEHLIYLEKIESPHSMRICTQVGQRIPVHCSAAGKAILSALPEDELRQLIGRLALRPLTDKTITDRQVLLSQLDEARKKGFAREEGEFENGLFCMAVPLLNYKKKSMAISISAPILRATKPWIESNLKVLKEKTNQIIQIDGQTM